MPQLPRASIDRMYAGLLERCSRWMPRERIADHVNRFGPSAPYGYVLGRVHWTTPMVELVLGPR